MLLGCRETAGDRDDSCVGVAVDCDVEEDGNVAITSLGFPVTSSSK